MNIKTNLISFIVLLFFLLSCTKIDFEGPSIENLYGDFEIIKPLEIINRNPSFSNNEQVSFHSEFNKPVEWKITIQGLNTGAYKEITGFSILSTQIQLIGEEAPLRYLFFLKKNALSS